MLRSISTLPLIHMSAPPASHPSRRGALFLSQNSVVLTTGLYFATREFILGSRMPKNFLQGRCSATIVAANGDCSA